MLTLVCILPYGKINAAYPEISAQAAVLIEAESGNVICEKAMHEVRPMASTTKIMTALVTLEHYAANGRSLDEAVAVDSTAVGVEGSSIYLKNGESLTMEALLYAMLLESANDAAAAIAVEVSGSIADFAALMNAKAEMLGLEHTSYADPHGLDDENNHSCAYDLAKLGAYALANDDFRQIVSTKKQVIVNESGDQSRLLVNHNKLLRLYEGTVGVKTGYTKKSGRCLVSAAERDGVLLIAVTLGAPDDWNDHIALFDYGFTKYECIQLADAGQENYTLPVIGGEAEFVSCRNPDALHAIIETGSPAVEKTVELKRFYYAPVHTGDVLGYAVFTLNGIEIGRAPLIAVHDVPQLTEKGFFERIADRIAAWFGK